MMMSSLRPFELRAAACRMHWLSPTTFTALARQKRNVLASHQYSRRSANPPSSEAADGRFRFYRRSVVSRWRSRRSWHHGRVLAPCWGLISLAWTNYLARLERYDVDETLLRTGAVFRCLSRVELNLLQLPWQIAAVLIFAWGGHRRYSWGCGASSAGLLMR